MALSQSSPTLSWHERRDAYHDPARNGIIDVQITGTNEINQEVLGWIGPVIVEHTKPLGKFIVDLLFRAVDRNCFNISVEFITVEFINEKHVLVTHDGSKSGYGMPCKHVRSVRITTCVPDRDPCGFLTLAPAPPPPPDSTPSSITRPRPAVSSPT